CPKRSSSRPEPEQASTEGGGPGPGRELVRPGCDTSPATCRPTGPVPTIFPAQHRRQTPSTDTLPVQPTAHGEGTSMALPQTGIFALGTPAHSYLEMRLRPGVDPRAAVAAATGLSEPRTTMGGVNLVIGIR